MTTSAPVAAEQDILPPFELTYTIDLVSVDSSKILGVSLYSGRAEITRLYKLSIKTGQNQVNINGLPNVLDRDSIKVEGRGSATIHDVTLSDIPQPPVPSTSDILDELLNEKELAEKALERAEKGKLSLEAYLATLNVQHAPISIVDEVLSHYDSRGEKLDTKILSLSKQLKALSQAIDDERTKLAGTPRNEKLGIRASIGVFAAEEGEVAIVLVYAVASATWSAAYDIRVDLQTKGKPVTLVYKAGITQDTGESWDNVPLSLETASPTFGVGIPTLAPWRLNVYHPTAYKKMKSFNSSTRAMPAMAIASSAVLGSVEEYAEDRRLRRSEQEAMPMGHRGLDVTSKGGITATFKVPGAINIPSDGVKHNVTVTRLELDAKMSWITVPQVDTKAHLKAKINNASDYTLLPGTASVYVDGSFISKSDVPLVSPLENFDCPLGLDPSIRITYHPRERKVSQSGILYSKTSIHALTQRITIHNTKPTPISDLKVLEQLPVSENSQITIKYLNPTLLLPEPVLTSTSTLSKLKGSGGESEICAPAPVKVAGGVSAQWEGAEEPGYDVEALGRDGIFFWMCAVPAQGKLNLVVACEVTTPLRAQVDFL